MHLAKIFKNIVVKYPDHTALKFGSLSISYTELDETSTTLAIRLKKNGVGESKKVALFFNDPVQFIATMLAVVKLSAIYVPFDKRNTQKNIVELCQLASVDFFLHDNTELEKHLSSFNPIFIGRTKYNVGLDGIDTYTLEIPPIENPVLYVMFTSGSTGTPKGVLVNHSGVSRFVENPSPLNIAQTDIFLQCSSVSFDASTYEIWMALLNGACLVLVPPNFDYSVADKFIKEYAVSILWMTTKLFETLVFTNITMFSNLKYLVFGGEACTHKYIIDAYEKLPNTILVNGYGPTENTVFTTMHVVCEADKSIDFIPIGKPVNRTTCYLLDENLKQVPYGEFGTLFVGGDGLAFGYLDEQFTKDKFIFHEEIGCRLYNTGDIVKQLDNGEYQYIGRKDRQVKVRGYRIELDYIEEAFVKIDNVLHVFAVYNQEKFKHGLVVFYSTKDNKEIENPYLQNQLKSLLPWYAIPTKVIFVNEIPYNTSQKVDIKKLIEKVDAVENVHIDCTPNQKPLEKIWMEVLGVDSIDPTKDFYNDYGGDSLTSLILISEVNKVLNLPLKTGYLLENPCFEQFERNLFNKNDSNKEVVLLKNGDGDIPIFLIPSLGGGSEIYQPLANNLITNQSIYSFNKIEEFEIGENFYKIDSKLISRAAKTYASKIARSISTKRVILGGYSSGGNIVVDMKKALLKHGIETVQIHLLDSHKFGNTVSNNCYEMGLTKAFFNRSVFFMRRYKKYLKERRLNLMFLANSIYKREINSTPIVDTPVFLYRSTAYAFFVRDFETCDWNKIINNLTVFSFDARHENFYKQGSVEKVAEKMALALRKNRTELYADLVNPDHLNNADLDNYLSNGWFRIRQQLFTDTHTVYEGEAYPIVWLRCNLSLFHRHDSHKKMFQKNKRFVHEISDLDYESLKDQLESLYAKYLTWIDFEAPKTVFDILYNSASTKNIFHTKSILLYDHDKLIGVGIFDVGQYSGTQITNFFDPEYARNSISKYLVVLTVEYLKSIGYTYFFPGYIFIGHPKMDYKLSFGIESIEYLDYQTKHWKQFNIELTQKVNLQEVG